MYIKYSHQSKPNTSSKCTYSKMSFI